MARAGGSDRGKRGGGVAGRRAAVRVKTARGRTVSSARWLERQLNDPYVQEAKRLGYRSRAAFKLAEIDDRFHFLRPGACIVDLGCAPGGWCQVAAQRIRPLETGGRIVGIDVTEVEPIAGVTILHEDFMSDAAPAHLKAALDGPADAVLSDMAAPATGHPQTDHLRIMALAEAAHDFAREVLKPGGVFVAKVLRGGTERTLLEHLKRDFTTVRHVKPPSSRADSAEMFVVATGFRGGD
ncbi:MAG: RlmE family RNA methyltransferase [Alphaproteobacteria bacterium]|nr:RlmE family RNA methyltransferase [Alphaproteobacteria bacterium]